MIPPELKYSEEHEWVRQEGETVTVGISHFAQDQLTDIVFVELPEVGRKVTAGEAIVVLESVKSVADVYAVMEGEITAVNAELVPHPELVNESPYDKGWLYQLKTSGGNTVKLMEAEAYQAFIETQ